MNSQTFDSQHPLHADRARLEKIADVMYAKIHKTLFYGIPGRRPRPETEWSGNTNYRERILEGTGISADDVLSEAFEGLLKYPPERLKGTWEGLAVGIAYNKAIDAIRASKKGLGGTDKRPPLRLVSGDVHREGPGGETEPSIFELLPSNWGNPEEEFFATQGVLELRNLARDILDDRAQNIFFAIHYQGYSRKEVGARLGLTGQRISQVYNAALRKLEAHPNYPYKLNN